VSKMCLDCEDAYTCIACVEKLRAERDALKAELNHASTLCKNEIDHGTVLEKKLETAREALEKVRDYHNPEDRPGYWEAAMTALAAISSKDERSNGEGK
jgi:hypothetical protein